MVEQPVAEPVSLGPIVEHHAMLARTRRAEIIGHGAYREDEIIIAYTVAADQLAAILIEQWRDNDLALVTVDAFECSKKEAIAPAVAVAAIADLVEIGVERSGRDFVEQGFPDMRAVAFHEDDVVPLPPIFRTEPPRELKPARAAADDHNLNFALFQPCLPVCSK